jgi:hypothetical protein
LTDFPDMKLKALVNFPASVIGGTGIDVVQNGGVYSFNLDFGELAQIAAIPTPALPTTFVALYESTQNTYRIISVPNLQAQIGGGGGIPEAPNDGAQYGRQSLGWTPVVSGGVPATAVPLIESGAGAVGVSTKYAREDHVHPALGGSGASISLPTGRLSLASATPYMSANQLNKGTVYYTGLSSLPGLVPDAIWLPSFNGTATAMINIGGEKSLALDSNAAHTGYHQAGSLFDVFWDDANARLCTGPAWTNNTTRSAALAIKNGFLVNAASMVSKFDATAGTFAVAANRGLFLGTIYCNAAASVTWQPRPAGVAGGGVCIIGLSNAYNRSRVSALNRDSTASWTIASTAWRLANNSANNKIFFLDCIQKTPVVAAYICAPNPNAGAGIGIGAEYGPQLDWVAGAPDVSSTAFGANTVSAGSTTVASAALVQGSWLPVLGLHEIDAVEAAWNANVIAIYASGWGSTAGQMQGLSLDCEY